MRVKKTLYFLIIAVMMFAAIIATLRVSAQQITAGSYNLRYDNKKDSGNLWKDRVPVVAALLQFHDFDIIGTQEGLKNQLDDIMTVLPDYNYYGLGRDDGKDAGEHSAIFFKKERFILLNKGDFWLSLTPEAPSLGWDAKCCKRLCSWVYLKDKKSKQKFYVFNAHYDHEGKVARIESSKLILEKIKKIAGTEPVIFTGDLNGGQATECYQIIANSGILKDSYQQVLHPYVNNGSFNAFGKKSDQIEIIDHVFVSNQFTVTKWGILTDSYHGKFPSDHFPVLVKLEIK